MNKTKLFWSITVGATILAVILILWGPREDLSETVPKTETTTTSADVPDDISAAPKNDEEVEVPVKLFLEMSDLPTMNEMQDLSEEDVHMTPKQVLKAGEQIGSMIEDADQHPEKQEPTLRFFMTCAENKDLVPAIRALCWNKALTNIPRWEKVIPLNDYDVPLEIQTLGSEL